MGEAGQRNPEEMIIYKPLSLDLVPVTVAGKVLPRTTPGPHSKTADFGLP